MLRQLRRWMYEKNLSSTACLTPEFEDGVTAFIKWAKSQYAHMDDEKLSFLAGSAKMKFSKSWTRYKPTRERNPNRKKTPYAILRYLALTPPLQRLYASEATAEQMTWHANHQKDEGSMCHSSDAEAWRHFDMTYPDFVAEPHNARLEEISLFTSHYFERQILCKLNRLCRNDDLCMNDTCIQRSIFNYPGQANGASKKRWLSGSERQIIEMYILCNCEVLTPYYESFFNELYEHHHSKDPDIEKLVATQFKD
ncbi:UNVERIFIED_CONTAM: hypothetical protein Slati_2935000 [Sesamum latifolium]|uniref:Uncharacterized protein n=1 Tax=Sesamum latifolium TaxID=2727402 RepID=A0AAW2VDU6_9LAMI